MVLGGAFSPGTKPGITPGVLVKLGGCAGAVFAEADGWTVAGAAGAGMAEDAVDGEGLPMGRIGPLSEDTIGCDAAAAELKVVICACVG